VQRTTLYGRVQTRGRRLRPPPEADVAVVEPVPVVIRTGVPIS